MEKIQIDYCPVCRARFNVVSSVTGKPIPQSGDITLCYNCGAMLIFNDDLYVRIMNEEELKGLNEEEMDGIHKAQKMIVNGTYKS